MWPRLRLIVSRCLGLLGVRTPDGESRDELRLHLTLLTERFVEQGMTPADAASAARRQFGNVTLLQQDHRAMRTLPSIENLWRAVRYGARQLRANPAFTAAAVLSLALGIGVNTAVFTLLDQLVLRPLPVAAPERLVMIWSTEPSFGDNRGTRVSSWPMCRDYQRRAVAFDSVFCRYSVPAALTVDNHTEPVEAELVSGNYFQALRVQPAAGRVFSAEADDRLDQGHPVVVLSHRYWTDRLGGDPGVVGKKVLVSSHPMEIVGVAAPGFAGMDSAHSPQIWIPMRMKAWTTPGEDGLNDRRYHFVQMFGRLRSGYTADSARVSLQPLFHQLLEDELKEPGGALPPFDRERFLKRTALVERAANGYSDMRPKYSTALVVLMGMAGLILLVACANVASLLIARAMTRRKEMAVRLSIGAGRGTLVAQLLVEHLLLACSGAALGLALSVAVTRLLLNMLPSSGSLLLLHAEPDVRILLFSLGMTLATVLLFGLAPALHATKVDLLSTLKDGAGGITGATRSAPFRKVLVAAQVALSFLLLAGAGLFVTTLANLKHTETGLASAGTLITFQVDPAKNGYSVPRIRRFYSDVLREMQATPGVTAAACTWVGLLQGWAPNWNMQVEGHVARDGEDMEIESNIVSPGYWKTMNVRLVEGRDFDERDRFEEEKLPTIAIVNRSFAERFFGRESPIGKRLGLGDRKSELSVRIVGVVDNSLYAGPRSGVQPMVYFSFLQANYPVSASFYARTSTGQATVMPAFRRLVANLDPLLPIYEMKTVQRQLDDTLSAERLTAALSVVFALLATVMSALGLYGVMTFLVVSRTKEIGLRTALGAPASSVVWNIMREALTLLAAGLVVGVPCSFLLNRLIASQLFGIAPTDLWNTSAAVAILAAVVLVSGFLPARRASTIDPLVALRHE